jgi:EamA domain-containing membrane protein RarD
MLAAVGLGLLIVKIVMPFGLHSLAILALSVAAGFGAYYYFSRQTDKE